jgi:putative tricarboxylic transport membrane protein
MLDQISSAAIDVLTIDVIGYIVLGVTIGYFVGAMPGLNRATALALLLPFTFTMSPLAAICFLIGINKGGAAGSAVSAILMNVPGEPSSVVTTLDGYPMTRQGRSGKALKLALYASVVGDILATVVLIILAAPLARLAVGLGPIELTAILLFAMTFIAAVSGRSFLKGIISGLLGLLLAAPRLDPETGMPRLTFGFMELYDGIPLLAVAIGTLALSEILVQIDRGWRGRYTHKSAFLHSAASEDGRLSGREFLTSMPAILRGSLVGTVIGLLPGLGASLSSFLAYTWAKRASATPARFGNGAPDGVAAAEAADNASVPASLIPVFAIGLPGSLATAILMGGFMMHGLTPGPFLLRDSIELVYAIFIGMLAASGILLIVGYFGQGFFSRVIAVRDTVIIPVIVFLCVVGAYLEGGGMFGVQLMLVFAFVGYFLKKFDFSFVTFLVGYILGPMAELSIRQAIIISDANPMILIEHPIAVVFLVLAVLSAWRLSAMNMLHRPQFQAGRRRNREAHPPRNQACVRDRSK